MEEKKLKHYILIYILDQNIYKVIDKYGTGAVMDGHYWYEDGFVVEYSYLVDDAIHTSRVGKFIEDSDSADELIKKAEELNRKNGIVIR